jgi:hypothetical protein
MIEQKTSTAVLEIAGPRGQEWRPAHPYGYLHCAVTAVESGRYHDALCIAEEAYQDYCKGNDIDRNYNQASFRIRVVSETLIGLFSAASLTELPVDSQPVNVDEQRKGYFCPSVTETSKRVERQFAFFRETMRSLL